MTRRPIAARIARGLGLVLAALVASTPALATATPEHRLEDDAGQTVATFIVRPGGASSIGVPAGRYTHVAPDGTRTAVTLAKGERFATGAAAPRANVESDRAPPPSLSGGPTPASTAKGGPPIAGAAGHRGVPAAVRHPWLAPVLATLLPGSGHALARRPGPAFGIFAAAAGLTFASVALALATDDSEGATLGDPGRSSAREALRLGTFVVTTDALALLWLGQAADSWIKAKAKTVRPRRRHVIGVSLHRASTVGLRPGEPSMARYEDLSLAVLGQVMDRLSIGLADISVHGRSNGRVTLQAGLRAAGRVVERNRVWLVVAGGVIFQGTSARPSLPSQDPDEPAARERGRFGAIGYGQLETRVFVLDRLSLDMGPRLSVPFATRYYGGGKALPRWAPTFELIAGAQVYF